MFKKERTFEFSMKGYEEALNYKSEVQFAVYRIKRHFKEHEVFYRRAEAICITILLAIIMIATTNYNYVLSPLGSLVDSFDTFKTLFNACAGI